MANWKQIPLSGEIVNADIAGGAAIATSKVSGALTSVGSHGLATSATTDTTNADNISSGTLAAARVATLNQNTTGSAATLTTSRTIGGVAFNGSANIDLPGVSETGDQDTSGNAATATALASSGTITFTGDVTGGGDTYTGGGNLSIALTVADNSVDGTDIALGSDAEGDIMYYDGSNYVRLAKGSDNHILAMNGNVPNWQAETSGGIASLAADSSPQLGGNLDTNDNNILIDDAHFIGDESGNEQIVFQTTSSAVNYLEVTNAATGGVVGVASKGDDSNIDLQLTAKGTGDVVLKASDLQVTANSATKGGAIVLNEGTDNGTSYVKLRGQASIASNYNVDMPASAGTLALTSQITGTNSNTNTGDETQATINALAITTVGALSSGSLASGFTDVPVAVGGTGASTASGARTNLGLVIGTDVQAYDANNATTSTNWAASDITSGTLAVARGGTGVTSSTGSGNTVLSASPTFTGTIGCAALTSTGDVTVGGNLVVTGTHVITNTETLAIADNTMVLNSDLSTSTDVDAGIVVERGSSHDNALFFWDEGKDRWRVGTNDDADLDTSPTYGADVMQVRIDGAAINTSSTEVPIGHLQYHSGDLYLRVED